MRIVVGCNVGLAILLDANAVGRKVSHHDLCVIQFIEQLLCFLNVVFVISPVAMEGCTRSTCSLSCVCA